MSEAQEICGAERLTRMQSANGTRDAAERRAMRAGPALTPMLTPMLALMLTGLPCCRVAGAQVQPPPRAEVGQTQLPEAPSSVAAASVTGTVVDSDLASIGGLRISVVRDTPDAPLSRDAATAKDGSFAVTDLPPGPYVLTIRAPGFTSRQIAVVLEAGEIDQLAEIVLAVAGSVSTVNVTATRAEIAQQQLHQQEKQRVGGLIANYYVSYVADPQPLTPHQKFSLAFHTLIDPSTFALVGALAGFEQVENDYAGYGAGPAGYGRRFGALYGGTVSSTIIGGAILPSLLKQDPRYFYKGTGTIRARAWYAIERSVICQGDNRRPQLDYSGILGGLASGAISNLYYPAANRDGAALTFENAGYGIVGTAAANLFEEFLIRKISTGVPRTKPGQGP